MARGRSAQKRSRRFVCGFWSATLRRYATQPCCPLEHRRRLKYADEVFSKTHSYSIAASRASNACSRSLTRFVSTPVNTRSLPSHRART